MIACPNPDCSNYEIENFEVETRYGITGSRLYVTCSEGHRFEVEVLVVAEPARHLPSTATA